MRISWVDRVTKKDVFWRTGEKRSLWKNFVKRRDKLIGHLSQHVGILKTIIEGRTEGRNYSGRPWLAYIEQIMEDVNCTTYVEMKRKAERRRERRDAANRSLDWWRKEK
jgi:hypothetical protein